jgi:hypothetical protein
MARTFVRAELVDGTPEHDQRFAAAMSERGFVRTVNGRTTHQMLQLPAGMYLIERKTAVQALGLAREASREANVEARIFCVAAGNGVRFGNLAVADETPASSAT